MCRVSAKISYKYDDEIEEVVVRCNVLFLSPFRDAVPKRPRPRHFTLSATWQKFVASNILVGSVVTAFSGVSAPSKAILILYTCVLCYIRIVIRLANLVQTGNSWGKLCCM